MKTLAVFSFLCCVFFSCIVTAEAQATDQNMLPLGTMPHTDMVQGGLENWKIMAIALSCLFVGLGLIFWLICCCCSRGGGMNSGYGGGSDVCCGSMCESEDCCGSGSCSGPMCYGSMCDHQACCSPMCCGPMCDHQSCCGPMCCNPMCCGPCRYQHTEVPAPVVKSAPYVVTRGPMWPQQQEVYSHPSCPPTGVKTASHGGMGVNNGGYAFGKSMDGNYSSGKPMYGGGGQGQCGPCGQH